MECDIDNFDPEILGDLYPPSADLSLTAVVASEFFYVVAATLFIKLYSLYF